MVSFKPWPLQSWEISYYTHSKRCCVGITVSMGALDTQQISYPSWESNSVLCYPAHSLDSIIPTTLRWFPLKCALCLTTNNEYTLGDFTYSY